MTSTQQVTYTFEPVDRRGNPAPVQGPPVWTNSNDQVATLTPAADGLSAVVKALVPGVTVISASADADLGEGVVTIAGTADVDVTPAAAVTVKLTAGEATEQEDVPPAGAAARSPQGSPRRRG